MSKYKRYCITRDIIGLFYITFHSTVSCDLDATSWSRIRHGTSDVTSGCVKCVCVPFTERHTFLPDTTSGGCCGDFRYWFNSKSILSPLPSCRYEEFYSLTEFAFLMGYTGDCTQSKVCNISTYFSYSI